MNTPVQNTADSDKEQEQLTGLRRSTRKRKSVSDEVDTPKGTRGTGKRPRPLTGPVRGQASPTSPKDQAPDQGAKMMRRSPVATKKQGKQGPRSDQPTGLTIQTDPPSEPTPEQIVLLGGMRALLQEELGRVEHRLGDRISGTTKNAKWKKLRPEQAKELGRNGEDEAASTLDMSELPWGDEDKDTFVEAEQS